MAKTATAARQKTVAGRIEREYRLYRIVAGDLGETCKAVAYLGMSGTGPVETVEAPSVDEAVSRMKDALEARLSRMRQERRDGIPTEAEFREGLAALPASVRAGIRGLHIERLDPLSPTSALATLSLRMQTDVVTIVEELRKTARKLGDLMDEEPQGGGTEVDPLRLLGTVDGTDSEGVPSLRFHDAFRNALGALPNERPATMVGRR